MDACACDLLCPARCRPDRLCDHPGCPCYQMWAIEYDELVRQTDHLSPAEIHQMLLDSQ
jgi:hypothetical protein